jgi:hypothetical protein
MSTTLRARIVDGAAARGAGHRGAAAVAAGSSGGADFWIAIFIGRLRMGGLRPARRPKSSRIGVRGSPSCCSPDTGGGDCSRSDPELARADAAAWCGALVARWPSHGSPLRRQGRAGASAAGRGAGFIVLVPAGHRTVEHLVTLQPDGRLLLLYLIVLIAAADVGAYFGGRALRPAQTGAAA